jgi:hypothetical protein
LLLHAKSWLRGADGNCIAPVYAAARPSRAL